VIQQYLPNDILGLDRCQLANVLDRQITTVFAQNLEQNLRPVTTETQQAQIRQWLLGCTNLAFLLGQFIRCRKARSRENTIQHSVTHTLTHSLSLSLSHRTCR
jgi:hypothetical protein